MRKPLRVFDQPARRKGAEGMMRRFAGLKRFPDPGKSSAEILVVYKKNRKTLDDAVILVTTEVHAAKDVEARIDAQSGDYLASPRLRTLTIGKELPANP